MRVVRRICEESKNKGKVYGNKININKINVRVLILTKHDEIAIFIMIRYK